MPASTPFQRGKQAELQGLFDEAKRHYLEEIASKGRQKLSAVKDLAWMMCRIGEADQGIEVLLRHQDSLTGAQRQPFEQLLAQAYIKAKKFERAAEAFERLYRTSADPSKRVQLQRDRAYCLYAAGRHDDALLLLVDIQRQSPYDLPTAGLIERVRGARAAQQAGSETAQPEEIADYGQFSAGVSPFGNALLDVSQFPGADDRAVARGFFEPEDIQKVERAIKEMRGRQARAKSDLYLTLARMCKRSPDIADDGELRGYLRRALTFGGEAAMSEKLHRDTARCYLAEALALSPDPAGIEMPIALLLSTYLPQLPEPGQMVDASGRVYPSTVLRQFESDQGFWPQFEADFAYYSMQCSPLAQRLAGDLNAHRTAVGNSKLKHFLTDIKQVEASRAAEFQRVTGERAALEGLSQSLALSTTWLTQAAATLQGLSEKSRFSLDKRRLADLGRAMLDASSYVAEKGFTDREARFHRLMYTATALEREIDAQSTRLSVEQVRPLAGKLKQILERHFEAFQAASHPVLDLDNALRKDDYYLPDEVGSITLRLVVESRQGGAPVSALEVLIDPSPGIHALGSARSPDVLYEGARREVELQIQPSTQLLQEEAFDVRAYVRYRSHGGAQGETKPVLVKVRLGAPSAYQRIEPNPYNAYAGGAPVYDSGMFIGRDALISQMTNYLTSGPVGQCYVLYGQKRSGKSSILHHLNTRLVKPFLAISVTIAALDTARPERTLTQECVDALRSRLEALQLPTTGLPGDAAVADNPFRSFREAMRAALRALTDAGWQGARLVLLIDEFTYLYEYVKEGLIPATFMRQWKALLDLNLFSAVVVGQDSMPKFKQEYPNEFGRTYDKRITYLAPEDAQVLATRPILLDGGSRYRSQSLDRLLELSGNSPFYTQILCDRLVAQLNLMRSPFATAADIDRVLTDLVSSDEHLIPIERFDPLITAAGESVSATPREQYLQLLARIAWFSNSRRGAARSEIGDFAARDGMIQDMMDREVLRSDAAGNISIRVQLFAHWLRANRPVVE